MTDEERDIISGFIGRVGGAAPAPSGFAAGSVPATTPPQPPPPPVDREADALIGELFTRYPEARYRITQLSFVQEHVLAEAQNRIKRLEWELQQAQQQVVQAQQAQQARPGGGFLGGLFSGGRPSGPPPQSGGVWNQGSGAAPGYQQAPGYPPPQPPPPQYAPGFQPGMFQRQGSGFLGSALTTAAGVAGGMFVGNALMGMFSPNRGMEGLGGGFGAGGASPWATPAALPEPPVPPDPGYVDQGSWDTPAPGADPGGMPDQSNWSDPGSDPSWGGDPGGGDPGGGGIDDNNTF